MIRVRRVPLWKPVSIAKPRHGRVIHFQTLGTLDLVSASGNRIRSVLAQPKRLGLLLYLALDHRDRPVSRERLAALIWPESPPDRARSSLRNALSHLRRSLGKGVVEADTHQVWIVAGSLSCDSTSLEEAVARGDWLEAAELAKGELAPGFALDDLREFDHWLEGRRTALRRTATRALSEAAREILDADPKRALRFLEAAGELSPFDEPLLQQRLRAFAVSGNRAAALTLYDTWARRLRDELEVDPGPETEEILRAIRSAPVAATVDPSATDAPARGVETTTAPVSPGTPPQRPGPRRTLSPVHALVAGFAGLAVLSAVALGIRALGPREEEAVWPVVTSFEIDGDGPAFVGDAVEFLVARALEAQGFPPSRPHDSAREVEVGGTVEVDGGSTRIRLEVDGRVRTAGGQLADLPSLANEVARAVILELGLAGAARPLPPVPTTEVGALAPFLEAMSALEAADFATARRELEAALALDSTFALAAHHLSTTIEWLGDPPLSRLWAEEARLHGARMSVPERRRLDAWLAYLQGDRAAATAAWESLAEDGLADVEVLARLGEVRFHWGPLGGTPRDRADSTFLALQRLAPRWATSLVHRIRHLGRVGSDEEFTALAARLRRLDLDDTDRATLEATGALRDGDRDAFAGLATVLASVPAELESQVVARVVVASPDPLRAREYLAGLPLPDDDPVRAVGRLVIQAYLAQAGGRDDLAEEDIRAISAFAPDRALEMRAALAVSSLAADRDHLLALRDSVAALPAPDGRIGRRVAWIAEPGIYPARKLALEAALTVRAGERIDLADFHARFDRLTDPWRLPFVDYVEGLATLSEERPFATLTALGPASMTPDGLFPDVLSYVRAHERWLRADALERLGRNPEALDWFGTYPDPAGYDLAWVPRADLRAAKILERSGRVAEAARRYALAARALADARGRYVDLLDEARAGVRRTRGAPESRED
ncbi:MAG: hypothetical protein D6701_11560 [Gemmatimonadetes bacterium]|nr:MAG: hypothetical protein D6701_11560 [Gemmatimonadota bacterium]